jgi:hypothetical protein
MTWDIFAVKDSYSDGNIIEEKYKFARNKDFGLLKIIGK